MKTTNTWARSALTSLLILLCALTGFGQVNTGKSVWVDATFGNNGTALRQRQDRPFSTLTAAKTAALAGDLIIVRPGTYTDTSLAKASVRWHFEHGTDVINSSPSTALFDDAGGTIQDLRVSGFGRFQANGRTGNTGGIVNWSSGDVQFEGIMAFGSNASATSPSLFKIGTGQAYAYANLRLNYTTGNLYHIFINGSGTVDAAIDNMTGTTHSVAYVNTTNIGGLNGNAPTVLRLRSATLAINAVEPLASVNVIGVESYNQGLVAHRPEVYVTAQSVRTNQKASDTGAGIDVRGTATVHFDTQRMFGNAITYSGCVDANINSTISAIESGFWIRDASQFTTTTSASVNCTVGLLEGHPSQGSNIIQLAKAKGTLKFDKIKTNNTLGGGLIFNPNISAIGTVRLIGGVIDATSLTNPYVLYAASIQPFVMQDVTVLVSNDMNVFYNNTVVTVLNCFTNSANMGFFLTQQVGTFVQDPNVK